MTLAANERMGTLAGGATVKKAFCFDCLTLLESDGETVTVTPMVPLSFWAEANAKRSALEQERDEAVAVGEWLAKWLEERVMHATDDRATLCLHCPASECCEGEDCAERLLAAARAEVRKQREVTK